MKKTSLTILFLALSLFIFGQTQYNPTVAWSTIVSDVVMVSDITYDITVEPYDINDVGSGQIEVGYYLQDYVGHKYSILARNVDSAVYRIRVRDDFRTTESPQTGQMAFVYKSVGDGLAPYIAPINDIRLDQSARDYSKARELDILWKKSEFNKLKVDSALNIPSDTTVNKLEGSIAILNGVQYWKTATKWTTWVSPDLTPYLQRTDTTSLVATKHDISDFVSFPGFGTTHSLSAYGDHAHSNYLPTNYIRIGYWEAGYSDRLKWDGGATGLDAATGRSSLGIGNIDNTSDADKPISTATQTALNAKIDTAKQGQANGIATLDSNAKIPMSQINDGLLGSMRFQTTWSPSTNTPTLPTPSLANKGYYWLASDSAEYSGKLYKSADMIVSDGATWQKIDNNNKLASVFGRTGNVIANTGDYNSDQVTEGSTNKYYTDARAALKQNVLTNPVTGTGASGQVTFWNGTATQAGDNGLFWDNTNKRLGVGTASPSSLLHLSANNPNTDNYKYLLFDNQASGYVDWSIAKTNSFNLSFRQEYNDVDAITLAYKPGGINFGINNNNPTDALNINVVNGTGITVVNPTSTSYAAITALSNTGKSLQFGIYGSEGTVPDRAFMYAGGGANGLGIFVGGTERVTVLNGGATTISGVVNISSLTASQIVETDASKNLISAAKATAYNKNFGTTTGTVLEGRTFGTAANNNTGDFDVSGAATTAVSNHQSTYNHSNYNSSYSAIYGSTLSTNSIIKWDGSKFVDSGLSDYSGAYRKLTLDAIGGVALFRLADGGVDKSQFAIAGGNTYIDYLGDLFTRSEINGTIRNISFANGNFHVGYTTDQGYKFAVNGNAYIGGSVTATGTITGSNLSGTNTGDNAVNSLYSSLISFPGFGTSGSTAAYGNHSHSGYVPYTGATADINIGSHTITGGNFILTTSDRRYKRNIKTISQSDYENASKIVFRKYSLKADSANTERFGVIAQELEPVLPKLVHTGKDGFKTVSYTEVLILKIMQLEHDMNLIEARLLKLEKNTRKNRFLFFK